MRRSRGCLGGLAATLLLAGWLVPGSTALGAEPGPAALETPIGKLWTPGAEGPARRAGLVNVTKLAVATAAAALLLFGAWLRRAGRPGAWRTPRDGLLATLGIVSLLGWWNFFQFHYPGFVHSHDTFNYYIGSKYFAELGYTRLYECVAVADLRAGLRKRVQGRRITNLQSYELEGTGPVVADPSRCTRYFSPARWSAFERDVAWFRSFSTADAWEDLQRDHGYNPPPSWGMLGTLLASTGPASPGQILSLTLLDPVLDLAMWAFAWWAFGWRATCVAVIYWGTNPLADFSWTGGAFLRDGWLAATVIGLGLLHRGPVAAGGFLLGLASLLRVFPVLALLGVGSAALLAALRERRLAVPREVRRLALGALAAAALVIPLSSVVAGGGGAWLDFAENTRLHVGTPAENLVGLRTLVSHDAEARLVDLLGRVDDPSAAWKAARLAAAAERRGLHALLVLAYLALLARGLLGQPPWVAAVLGIGALPVLTSPACYYTSALAVFGFLSLRREGVGAALCALSAASWGVAAGFSEWDDVFLWASVPVLAFVVYATGAVRAPLRSRDD